MNISAIEIDLSIFKKEKFKTEILKDLLINNTKIKKWIFNSNEMALLNKRTPYLNSVISVIRSNLNFQIERRREEIEKEKNRKIKEIQSLEKREVNNIPQKKETIKITPEMIELSKKKIIKEAEKYWWYLEDCPKIFKKTNKNARVNIFENCIKCEYQIGFRDNSENFICLGYQFLYDDNKYNFIL